MGLAALTAGCAPHEAAGRLSWWAMAQEGDNAPALLPDFEAATGIRVDVQKLPWTAAHQKLLTAHAGGSLPDVLMMKNSWVPELALVGALRPLPAQAGTGLGAPFPGAVSPVRVHGRPVAMPWIVDGWVQFYRPDLLAAVGNPEPPTRWDDWIRMAAALKRRAPDRFVTLHLLDWPEPLFAMAADTGVPMLRDRDTRGNFAAPAFRATLARYKSLYDLGYAPRLTGAEVGDTLIALRRGTYAILPSNAATIGDLRRRKAWFPESLWTVAETPGLAGPARTPANGYSLSVTAQSSRPDSAWSLIEHLTRPPAQQALYRYAGDLPARPSAWGPLARDPVTIAFARAADRSVVPPAIPEWEQIVTEVQTLAERMVRGDLTLDAAAWTMDRRVDHILSKRRWLLDRGLIA